MKLSFDGKGINDASNQYAPRIATFTNADAAQQFGKSLEAMPDLLTALQQLVDRCESHGCEKWFPHVIDRAKLAIERAKS
jgi:hypothetical protein